MMTTMLDGIFFVVAFFTLLFFGLTTLDAALKAWRRKYPNEDLEVAAATNAGFTFHGPLPGVRQHFYRRGEYFLLSAFGGLNNAPMPDPDSATRHLRESR